MLNGWSTAPGVPAGGYSGPPPLTPARLVTTWQVTPAVLAALLLGAAYWWAVRRARARGMAWPRARVYCFLGGVAWLLLITGGWVGGYSGVLFWVRAVRNVSLLMIVPMLLAMGAPLTLARELLGPGARARLGRVGRSRAARVATFPLVVTPVFLAPLPLLYLTPLYPAGLAHGWVDGLVGVWLLGAGWLYFWTRFRIDPTPRTDPYVVSLGISVAEVVLDGALGLAVWLGPLLAPHYYLALHRPWGPDAQLDQIIGAGVLWIGGDLAGLPFLGVVLRRMTSEDAEQAAEIDAELDRQDQHRAHRRARDVAAAGAGVGADGGSEPGTAPGAASPQDAERPRLWWEDHPELAERFRRR
jgi:cytochrome c oxidase assembly factor CtaG